MFQGYKVPTRRTVQRQLKRLRHNHTQILSSELEYVDSLAVTTDLWSDKRLNSYMCLTGHFLNSDSKLSSKVLSFTVFRERHTGDQISNTIKKELKRLQVYEKTHTITCDGASNMRKAFKSLQPKRVYCLGHRLHLTVCNALCLWVKESEQAESSPDDKTNKESVEDVEDLSNDSNASRGEYRKDLLPMKKNILSKYLLFSLFTFSKISMIHQLTNQIQWMLKMHRVMQIRILTIIQV